MAKTECILVVIDPTAEHHFALRRAATLARKNAMRLELLVCDYSSSLVQGTFLNRDRMQSAKHSHVNANKKKLEKIAAPYRAEGLDVATTSVWDRPLFEGIIRHALRTDARFVVKDTHYHSAISRALFTNTDWHLIRSCPAPLWLVKPHHDYESPTILAAVDPMHQHGKPQELDTRLLLESFYLSAALGGQVHVGHVFNPYEDPADPQTISADHEQAVRSLTEKLQVNPDNVHIRAGSPVDVLPMLAMEVRADLTVMGSISRSRLENAILGSTAENVMDRIGTDILVLKPEGFLSPITFKQQPDQFEISA